MTAPRKLAFHLLNSAGMKKTSSRSHNVLRWIFRRGNHFMTCQLTRLSNRSRYVLALVPHWDASQGDSESFDSGLAALQRHASIASSLRESGWKVVAYSGPSPFTPDFERAVPLRAA
jgi:hypothetical protein